MPAQELARQWFIPGDGIDRHVISTDIQRYLGNDATVRPGRDKGIDGYWIKAYRNLTSAMISDLRSDSARWKQEQRVTGSRGSHSPVVLNMSGITEPDRLLDYNASRTYEQGSASVSHRRNAESPSVMDGAYGVSNSRPSARGAVDAMQIDAPNQPDMSRYGQPSGQPTRGVYPPDNGPNPSARDRFADSRSSGYQADVPMSDNYGRGQVQQPFGQDSRYAGQYQQSDAPPAGYVRQGDYYVPITSGYGQSNIMASSRPEPQQFPSNPFGQPQEPPRDSRGGRDPRDGRDGRDPRYGQQDFNDASRYYPSPATTAASVGSRDTISSPSGPSYGNMPAQFDQFGRPVQQPAAPYGAVEPGYPSQTRDTYGRQPAAPQVHDSRDRDARRRRLH